MKTVYLLFHTHQTSDSGEDPKILGVYATNADVKAAQQRALLKPGFKEHGGGFTIDEYEIGKDHWAEGFQTISTD